MSTNDTQSETLLVEIAAKAAHAAFCEERDGSKLHAPEECPNGDDCTGCRAAFRPWDKLTAAAREGFRRQAQPIVAAVTSWTAFAARLETFLAQFPDDATGWEQATDELPDMVAWLGGKRIGCDASCSTPSEWNQKHKAVIRVKTKCLSAVQRTAFEGRFEQWLDEAQQDKQKSQAAPCTCPSWVNTVADLLGAEAKTAEHAIEVTERLISESKAYTHIKTLLQGHCLPNETYASAVNRLVRNGKLNPISDVDVLAALERLEDKKRKEMTQSAEQIVLDLTAHRTDGLNELTVLKQLANELRALRIARRFLDDHNGADNL